MFRAQRIDPYLPKMFGSVHRRFRTPWVAIGFYGLAGIVVALLSQTGTPAIRLQDRPAGPEVIRVWGRPVAIGLAWMGLATTMLTIVLSVIPSGEETNKALAVAKVLISTAVLVGAGVAVFAIAQRKKARALALIRP